VLSLLDRGKFLNEFYQSAVSAARDVRSPRLLPDDVLDTPDRQTIHPEVEDESRIKLIRDHVFVRKVSYRRPVKTSFSIFSLFSQLQLRLYPF